MFGKFHADELMWTIGFVDGRVLVGVAGCAVGYVGINVLIGVMRWFEGL